MYPTPPSPLLSSPRSEIISGIQNIGSDVINKVVEGTKDAATTVYDGAQNVAQDAANAVSGGVNTAIDTVQDVAGTIGQGAGDAVDKVKDFLGGLFGRKLLADAATCGYIACAPAVWCGMVFMHMYPHAYAPR